MLGDSEYRELFVYFCAFLYEKFIYILCICLGEICVFFVFIYARVHNNSHLDLNYVFEILICIVV